MVPRLEGDGRLRGVLEELGEAQLTDQGAAPGTEGIRASPLKHWPDGAVAAVSGEEEARCVPSGGGRCSRWSGCWPWRPRAAAATRRKRPRPLTPAPRRARAP